MILKAQFLAASAVVFALLVAASPAYAVMPNTVTASDAVLGTAVSVDVHRDGTRGPIYTDVTVLDADGPRTFTMMGGELGGIGLWTEEYAPVKVGDIVAAQVEQQAGALTVAQPPLVVGGASDFTAAAVGDYKYEGLHWLTSALPMHWRFYTTSAPAGAQAAVQAGAQTWEDDAGSLMDYTFDGTTSSYVPDAQDGVNSVGWAQNASGSELGHCLTWYYPDTGVIAECDINFNLAYTWSTSPSSGQYDIQTVALHEFGHTLQLADLYDMTPTSKNMVMYGYTASGTTLRALQDGDIAGVRAIYPGALDTVAPDVTTNAVPSYTGTANITITASDADSGVNRIEWRIDSGSTTTVYGTTAVASTSDVGQHTLYYTAYDNSGNNRSGTAVFSVADGMPPVTTVSGVPSWSRTDVSVTLSAVDVGGSGVAATYYRIGSGLQQTYGPGPFTVSGEGVTTVSYWSVDTLGNTEVTKTVDVRIDPIAPGVSSNAVASYTGPANVTISGTDDRSGVQRIEWRVDSGSVTTAYSATTLATVTDAGTHTLYYTAYDNAGNSTSGSATFSVTDAMAPITSVFGVGSWSKTDVAVSMSAVDVGGSGVAATYYRLGGGSTHTYSAPFTVSTEGVTPLTYWSVDTIGNTEGQRTLDVRIDKTAPGLTSDATTSYAGAAYVRITGTDALSGVAQVGYRVDGGSAQTFSASSADAVVSSPGAHTLAYWTVDAAGNRTDGSASFTVVAVVPGVDVTPPHTALTGAPASGWATRTVSLALSAVDAGGSGVSATIYRINDGLTQVYTGPIDIAAEGVTHVAYWSVDGVGNVEAAHQVDVRLDKTAPEMVDDAESLYGGMALITVETTDTLSGVAEVGWSVDGGVVQTTTAPVATISVASVGAHNVAIYVRDAAGNRAEVSLEINVVRPWSLKRTPSGSSYTLRRRGGKATWKTTVTLRNSAGALVSGQKVRLQRRLNSGAWTTMYEMKTGRKATASRTLILKSKRTEQWRWYLAGDGETVPVGASSIVTLKVK